LSNFWTRTFAGIVFLIVLIGSIVWSEYSFFVLFLFLSTMGTIEFYNVAKKSSFSPQKWIGVMISVLLYSATYCIVKGYLDPMYMFAFFPLILFVFIFELFRKTQHPIQNIAYTVLGIFYVSIPFALLHLMVFDSITLNYNFHFILGAFIIIWSNDTGAYLTGLKFGRTKLFERISPKKTWEGSIGGFVFAMVAAFFISRNFIDISFYNWLVIAFINVVTGSLGDLVESMLKRSVNIKDSGNIIPGHGGILDRFDSFLFSAPFVVAYLMLM
jgi:phosphatidate cytidylyltransferase